VRTVAVGIGHGINRRELRQIAMSDDQYVVQVSDFDALKDKLQMILDESCQGILLFIQNISPILIGSKHTHNSP